MKVSTVHGYKDYVEVNRCDEVDFEGCGKGYMIRVQETLFRAIA